ncbi:hypothetical protein [Rubripirellula reticaptiva]|uniref:hypothetical protein n=1 Tax=Rubripirellula reticaptiva TaxID=2528013 RepID=UPI001C94A025|nr:hypothetical protein [Rubripirellula reticaptiva]
MPLLAALFACCAKGKQRFLNCFLPSGPSAGVKGHSEGKQFAFGGWPLEETGNMPIIGDTTVNKNATHESINRIIEITKFSLGALGATPGALEHLEEQELYDLVQRHASGDWGNCSEHDREANEDAIRTGARIFSIYQSKSGEKIWIITEASRASTTVLLPSDY